MIAKISLHCTLHCSLPKKSIAVTAIVEKVNDRVTESCKNNKFHFIFHQHITRYVLYHDGVHLTDPGTEIIADNVVDYMNNFISWQIFTHRHFLPYTPSQHFGTTCFYQGFPGSRQLFFEIRRASYWSSKHRPGPSLCLIHSNPQSFIHLKFVFIHVNIAKVLLVVKTLIRSAATLFSSHENIKQQPN